MHFVRWCRLNERSVRWLWGWRDQVPPEYDEGFTCALCQDDFDLTGLEIVINDNRICGVYANDIYQEYKYKLEKRIFRY